jgi:hypothetical protein
MGAVSVSFISHCQRSFQRQIVREEIAREGSYYKESYAATKSYVEIWDMLRFRSNCSDLLRMLQQGPHFQQCATVYLTILQRMAKLKLSIVKQMRCLRCAKTC